MAQSYQAVVLLSAGLDSAYNLFEAKNKWNSVLALTFDYGQRAAVKERARSAELCRLLNVDHQIVELPFFKYFTKSSLHSQGEVPTGSEVAIDDLEQSQKTADRVWVANRNGIFLNIAAGFAEGFGAEYVIPGFNKEEAQTFPDNSEAFIKALNYSLAYSTRDGVKVMCFSTNPNKTEIVRQAQKLNMPFEKLWPCYFSNEDWCGECESCQRFKRALKEAQVEI